MSPSATTMSELVERFPRLLTVEYGEGDRTKSLDELYDDLERAGCAAISVWREGDGYWRLPGSILRQMRLDHGWTQHRDAATALLLFAVLGSLEIASQELRASTHD